MKFENLNPNSPLHNSFERSGSDKHLSPEQARVAEKALSPYVDEFLENLFPERNA